ncbi:MAG: flagellar protein FlaG [Lachnospiraceae bacterium]|nr:flagellar protein FlaG [Lachnospiraceae bacterium]
MAVEPIGSVMSYQAQQFVAETSNKSAEKNTSTAAYTEGTAQDESASQAVDNKIVVVESSAKAEDGSKGDNGQAKNESASNEQIKKAVEELNKKMSKRSEALFGIHEDTNRLTIKIVDQESKKVIKEFPPEKTLDMIAKVWEMAGIIVDEKG